MQDGENKTDETNSFEELRKWQPSVNIIIRVNKSRSLRLPGWPGYVELRGNENLAA